MIDMNTFRVEGDGEILYSDAGGNDAVYSQMFDPYEWDAPEAFHMAGIEGYDPMTAKELDTEELKDAAFNSVDNIIEEKFDGTRGLLYFLTQTDIEGRALGFCRLFSRRISRKTGFYVENTDSCPQFREIDVPALGGTILDGELFINGLPFKEVSSTLNCTWDKAVRRQIEKGFITLHAFDILFYKGQDLRGLPLLARKAFLFRAVQEADCPYIEEVSYFSCGGTEGYDAFNLYDETAKRVVEEDIDLFFEDFYDKDFSETYPALHKAFLEMRNGVDAPLPPRAYYELIVYTGGEGVIVKSKDGLYHHKRGWEYSKVKKFFTRDLILMGFEEPTKEYTGKDVSTWRLWVDENDERHEGEYFNVPGYVPVTRHYFNRCVGNMILGSLIEKPDYERIPANKRGEVLKPSELGIPDMDDSHYVMTVCVCSGFDDESRERFTREQDSMIGGVVEVKANEEFQDTGRLRHPRFIRLRPDKEAERCLFEGRVPS